MNNFGKYKLEINSLHWVLLQKESSHNSKQMAVFVICLFVYIYIYIYFFFAVVVSAGKIPLCHLIPDYSL